MVSSVDVSSVELPVSDASVEDSEVISSVDSEDSVEDSSVDSVDDSVVLSDVEASPKRMWQSE